MEAPPQSTHLLLTLLCSQIVIKCRREEACMLPEEARMLPEEARRMLPEEAWIRSPATLLSRVAFPLKLVSSAMPFQSYVACEHSFLCLPRPDAVVCLEASMI